MDAMGELISCPFCGGAAKLHDEGLNGSWVGCKSCAAKVGYDVSSMYSETLGDFETPAEAIAAWNRRTPSGCGPLGETDA